MKIDANRPGVETTGQLRADRASESARQAEARQNATGDRVSLSATAELARTAAEAAGQAPEIRAELVERMRALRAAGQLGADPERLADAMIEHMVVRRDRA